MAQARFNLKRSTDGQHYFNLSAANSEIILTSELYTSRSGAVNGIGAVRDNASNDARYDRLPAGDQYYFTLRAANGEIIGTSQRYTTRSARDEGIEAVKRNAVVAEMVG